MHSPALPTHTTARSQAFEVSTERKYNRKEKIHGVSERDTERERDRQRGRENFN